MQGEQELNAIKMLEREGISHKNKAHERVVTMIPAVGEIQKESRDGPAL